MFRIRRIYDDLLRPNREALRQVETTLVDLFPDIPARDVDGLREKLRNPFTERFRSIVYVVEGGHERFLGFALVMVDPELEFSYLNYIAAARGLQSRGVGGALYEVVRSDARAQGARGLFFECLPDDPNDCPDPVMLEQNRARLRFYERYGARPIIGTQYQLPLSPGDTCMPLLVFDDLGRGTPLRRLVARKVVRAILERRYGHLCPPAYVEAVVRSFCDDPVRMREPIYTPKETAPEPLDGAIPAAESGAATGSSGDLGGTGVPEHPIRHAQGGDPIASPHASADTRPAAQRSGHGVRTRRTSAPIALVINDRHQIHHVRERGYVEAPVRIARILDKIKALELFDEVEVREHSMRRIKAVHDPEFVEYLKRMCEKLPPGSPSVYPYIFPLRNQARRPKELAIRAGYYCIDTFTPLNHAAFLAARRAVDCALTAAELLLEGYRMSYALVRPPGHHAERRTFGGFCYFNNNALAADLLSAEGKVAILDVDYHHGNGQQDIFYRRSDVLTVSIHGHPNFAYPYFTGFAEEQGEGEGQGFNLNLPLPEQVDSERHRRVLGKALKRIRDFEPAFLVVALGLDTARADPTGTWSLLARDFRLMGLQIGQLDVPTIVVQEGGYRTRTLGVNAREFFSGLYRGAHGRRR